jgi:hypothetical protein
MKLRKSMTVNAAAMMLIAGVALAAAAFLTMPTTLGDDVGHRWRAASQMHRFVSPAPCRPWPHYIDQAPLYARGEFKPAWFSSGDVKKNAKRAYHPGE